MGMYVKGYAQRAASAVLSVAIMLISSLLCYGMFHSKLNIVGGQLSNYNSADYSIIYVLNYGETFDNECIFPDANIQLFLDKGKTCRLTVSSVMKEEGVVYDLEYLSPVSNLGPGEICLSQNVADMYKVNVGDTLFAEYPYSSRPIPITVAAITSTEFDYLHPYVDNSVGVVFLGFNEKYSNSTNSKYLVFSVQPIAKELSAYPQIINAIINKSELISKMSSQGLAALIFTILFTSAAIYLSQLVFFFISCIFFVKILLFS